MFVPLALQWELFPEGAELQPKEKGLWSDTGKDFPVGFIHRGAQKGRPGRLRVLDLSLGNDGEGASSKHLSSPLLSPQN